ncbi:hypothetical protein SLEP1_g57991 [Rubroshorea leprosula]|uniref:AAA+ ATPase domain-containing protein n=1 Tax=Rubroshorea leprosula TaxID=152421 RepID=A0AAV5MMW0_9ROSI|nr:hypothetical protein SLEP1_g57991 [Rubroshorea leprosula]
MSQKKQAKIKIHYQQLADLEEEKERVERYVNNPYGSSDSQKMKDLNDWLRKAKNFINGSAKKLISPDVGERHVKHKYSFKLCPNFNSPWNCEDIGVLVQEARRLLEDISRGDQNGAVNRFEYFEWTKNVLDGILEAAQCPSINTISVHGESGTGKTMLVRAVKRIAEEQKLFDAVVMASVKQNPRIQDEIARDLGVSNELTYQEASNRRKERKLTEKRVLLILDDVWEPEICWKLREKLPLEDENENRLLSYKILLTTTRDSRVLFDLSEIQFEIKPLEEKEAWMLFEKIATYRTESRRLPFYAREICKKCYGLPIAIATLAMALKGGRLKRKTILQELQSQRSLHSSFYKSYDCLKSFELQQTFLLCSLMGHNAAIQDLLKYTIGLDLFPGVKSVEEARDALLNSMTKLKDSSLLLDRGGNMHFDMHDLLMIFAKSIAFREVGLNNWEEMKSIKWVHLSNTSELPIDKFNCPQLIFFHLSKEDPSKPIPLDLFTGTEGLTGLGLTKTCSLPQSISLPIKLLTLRLDQSVLRDVDMGTIIRKLRNLQVLSLVGCDLEELPVQIRELTKLKLLDLSDCTKLKVIPPNVLSGLPRLEELYMRNSFDQWAEGVKERPKEIASLSELKQLTNLKVIEVRINICNIQMMEEDLFSENLARYKIYEGNVWHFWDSSYGSSKILKLKLDAKISFEHHFKKLLKRTEELHLQGLNGVNSFVNELDEEGFQELKYLCIQDAQNVQHIINSMRHDAQNADQDSINSMKPAFPVLEVLVLHNLEQMEKICHGLVKESSFSKLRMITVESCNQLKNLFSSSIARRNFLQLQEIRVLKCSDLEEIVDDDEQGGEKDVLKELCSLRLEDLPKLIAFNCNCKRMTLFQEQVASFSAGKLMKLIIKGCDNLKCIFSSSMARDLKMLKHLEIRKCSSMKEVILKDNNVEEKMIFPQLNILQIEDLEDLVNFYSGNCIEFKSLRKLQVLNCPKLEGFIANTQTLFNEQVEFPKLDFLRLSSINTKQIWHISSKQIMSFENLKNLFVEGCGNLEYLLTSSMVKSFKQLMVLKISDCKMMEEVIKVEERMCEISFPELDTLELEELPKLTRFYLANSNATISECLPAASIENVENTFTTSLFHEKVGFPKLKFLSLSSIDNLKYLFMSSMVKSFKQLMVLKICDCKMMEQVIVSNEVVEEMMCESFFSKLDTLELEDLPKLVRLCHGNYSKFKFSMLRRFTISKCAVLKTLIGNNAVSSENVKNTYTPSLFDEKVELPRLEQVIIKFMGNWSKIWDDKHDVNSCSQLNSLTVDSCENLLNIFPFSMLERVRQKLDTLKIQNCDSLEEIFGASQPQAQITTQPTNLVEIVPMFLFPELTHINLSKLPKLKGFIPQIHINEWPSLKQLQVHGCDEVQIFASELPSFLGINEDDKLQIQLISKGSCDLI